MKLIYKSDKPDTCPAPLWEQYSAEVIERVDSLGVTHREK